MALAKQVADTAEHECWQRGLAAFEQGCFPEAAVAWREAVRLDPEDADYRYNLGLALSELGQQEEAVAEWQQAVRLYPDYAEAWHHLAYAYEERARRSGSRADWGRALDAFRKGIGASSDSPSFLRCIASIEYHLGHKRQAIQTLKDAIRDNPGHHWLYDDLWQMQCRTRRWATRGVR